MPFFETVIIARCGNPKSTSGLLKTVAEAVLSQGGTVRDMKILGDRALARSLSSKEGQRHMVGRYVHVKHK